MRTRCLERVTHLTFHFEKQLIGFKINFISQLSETVNQIDGGEVKVNNAALSSNSYADTSSINFTSIADGLSLFYFYFRF